jgi:hypothetical protein
MNNKLDWQEQAEERSTWINKSWNDQIESMATLEIQIHL